MSVRLFDESVTSTILVQCRKRIRLRPPKFAASIAFAGTTLVVTAMSYGPSGWRRAAERLAIYHAGDLAHGRMWRLPMSAFLAQSWAQLVWTLLLAATAVLALEALTGTIRVAIVLGAAHLGPTLLVAAWAQWTADQQLLTTADYGTSCVVMGAAAGLASALRSRTIVALIVAAFCVDVWINAPYTIIEHLMSVILGAALVQLPAPAARTAPGRSAPPAPARSPKPRR